MSKQSHTAAPGGALWISTAAALAFLVAACGGAQDPEAAPPEEEPADPVAEEEPADEPAVDEEEADEPAAGADALAQAESGAEVYDENCAFCHGDEGEGAGGNPAVVGDELLAGYADAGELFDYVSTEMPEDDPGGLSDQEFQNVVAFMLAESGVDLEGQSVTAEGAAEIAW